MRVLFVVVFGFCVAGQSQIGATCPERAVIVNVTNKYGQAVSGAFEASEFAASTQGKLLPVSSVSRFYISPRVFLLIDTSGSMQHPAMRRSAAMAVESLLEFLPVGSPVGVVTFAVDSAVLIPPTEDRVAVLNKLRALFQGEGEWKGRTDILSAAAFTIDQFGAPQRGDSIVLISDTGHSLPGVEMRVLKRKLWATGVRLFGNLVRDADYRGAPDEFSGFMLVREMVEGSGGFAAWITEAGRSVQPNEQRARMASGAIAARISAGYLVHLRVGDSLAKSARLKMSLTSADPKRTKAFKLEYPAELAPCSTSPAPTPP